MSYFRKIGNYQTYSGHDSEFHYDFNANSGGGQAFLGGRIIDTNGVSASPSELEGCTVSFAIRFRDQLINLGGDNTSYAISPRSAGSQNMKLGVQGNVNPNLLIAAALMLPKTCGRNMALSITVSPLTTENYWLRSMWLDVDRSDIGTAVFIPKDFVFEGGLSKRQGVTTQKDTVVGAQQFFKLDYTRRLEDIVALASDDTLPGYALETLSYYRDVYQGHTDFDYEGGATKVVELMRRLSLDYSDAYSGYSDPLDFLMVLGERETDPLHVATKKSTEIHLSRNLIFFGAPGTGKSYELNKLAVRTKDNPEGIFPKDNVRRVTFYPDYTYSQFVGGCKPYIEPKIDQKSPARAIKYEPGSIEYQYVPGPFIDTYVDAIGHPGQCYLLIVEEINRANPAAVFGDVFQLLDRKDNGESEYSVVTSEDLRWYLFKYWKSYLNELKPDERNGILYSLDDSEAKVLASSISLPSNMFIWATMNSADQGVLPMDTAFKRRWDFRYMGIDEGEDATPAVLDGEKLSERTVAIAGGRVVWNKLRKAINMLLLDCGVNEDKLLGPFFLSPESLNDEVDEATGKTRFTSAFEDKVLLYLYEDAGKMRRGDIFWNKERTFAEVREKFENDGVGVFARQSKKGKNVFDDVYATDENMSEVSNPTQADED